MNLIRSKALYSFCLILGLLNLTNLLAQNTSPTLDQVVLKYDLENRLITIEYDLYDQEESAIEVSVQVVDGKQHAVPMENWKMEGELGFPVATGTGKSIQINYPSTLENLEGYQLNLIADDRYEVDLQKLVDQVDKNNLKANLEYLLGDRSHKPKAMAHLEASRDTIVNSFKAFDLEVCRQDTNITKGNFQAAVREILGKAPKKSSNPEMVFDIQNIVATLSGNNETRKTFIVGAHYDSVFKSPGADDNASGVAGMIEVARILSEYQFDHNIKFVAFDLEEAGLLGSWMYLLENREKVDGFINLDMIGCASDEPNTQTIPEGYEEIYPEVCKEIMENEYRGNFLISTTNENSAGLSNQFLASAAQFVPDFTVYSLGTEKQPSISYSDHLPFWKLGYPAIFVGNGGDTRNPHLNSPKDVAELINYDFMEKSVKTTLATMAEKGGINHSTKVSLAIIPNPTN